MGCVTDWQQWHYTDEEGRRLRVTRGPSGTACVRTAGAPPVAVLAEHVPEVCAQLHEKAGLPVPLIVPEPDDDGEGRTVVMGGAGTVTSARGRVALSVAALGAVDMSPERARGMAAALLAHAKRADHGSPADVRELAAVLAGAAVMAGDVSTEVARAVLDAGYRKQGGAR